ncbi:hypothetical protein KO500_15765 [Cellulophaga baltica]|uniref:hypothetical protein n=1 Tax=Cellulophaga TaxID=104264 RepID=UPI001C0670EF|nr:MULTISPECIES: hypothetical protein [Cellulophaga]MBU2997899.1 hypothetical protein [Cellulophaga baltica]MDO6769300.1 hypothetical protein [Cellulophaga sp. 1_MG-2023]
MARAMLEYTKTVLKKVSFDTKLFCREVQKAISTLLPEEVRELKLWLQQFINDKPELQQSLIYIKSNNSRKPLK